MKQVDRNLTDSVDGFLRRAGYLIHDRDPLFSKAFIAILKGIGETLGLGIGGQDGFATLAPLHER